MLEAEIVKLDELFERSKSEVERIKGLPRNDQQAAFDTLPSEIKSFPAVALWRKQQDWASAPPSGRDVVIYTGMGWEMWNPESAKTGIGGSEEAVIYLARELSTLGWNVKVYGNHGTEPKDYDGVTYVPFWEWSPKEETDIFISWRDASIFDMDIRARKRYLWLHDTNAEADLSESRLEKIDKVIVLSKYHRSLYPNKPDEKFMLSANGIVPEQFNIDVPRNPKKCVYASAPDRGLHCLLQMWPKIREQVPDAELYWAYGWNTFDLAAASNPQLQVLKNEIQMMLRQPGVTELGRIGHKEVAKLMMSSALWLYPTMFTEIFPVHGDTLIETSRGAVPIKKLVGKKDVFVYSWNQDKRLIELSRVLWCGRTRKDAEVVRVDMKYGVGRNAKKTCSLTLTPDHPVMMRDGSWKPAGELLMGDRVMPMNRVKNGWGDGYDLLVAGYEASEAAHRIACRYHTTELQGKDVDHIDGDVSNNDPSNLQALSRSEHWKKTWAAKSIEERKAWAKGVTGNIRRHEKKLGKNAISEERRKAAKVRWSKRLGDNHVVTKVSRAPNADVFCMEVEPNHNFVANSVVVHNCITAIKAQASGAMPITTNVAALEETVQDGIKFDVKDIYYNEEAQDKFIAATVKALQNPPDHEAIKAKATGRWSWSSVAKQWDNEFSR
jgi:hypothetical protein